MNSAEMRAGDADRDRVVAALRDAFAEGRLTQSEFDDRLNQAHHAKTMGDLDQLTADLPTSLPAPVNAPVGTSRSKKSRDLRAAWGAWVGVGVLMIVIWFATGLTSGSFGFFWPIWVIGPWGAAMLIAQLTGGSEEDR